MQRLAMPPVRRQSQTPIGPRSVASALSPSSLQRLPRAVLGGRILRISRECYNCARITSYLADNNGFAAIHHLRLEEPAGSSYLWARSAAHSGKRKLGSGVREVGV